MIGSETFIMVALRCTENSTSSALARTICSVRKASSADAFMTVASTTSPCCTVTVLRTASAPSAATSLIVSVSAAGMMTDCSLLRKSSAPMVATAVLLCGVQAPIEWGCLRA